MYAKNGRGTLVNHLIIGLGGTGGKTLAAIRRLILQQYHEVEPTELALNYLYVDTSAEDVRIANITAPLTEGDLTWRTRGRSVQLSPSQIVHLAQGNFAAVVENPEDYEGFNGWLGDTGLWRAIWNSAPNGIEAGGQLRRFGRYLLAQNIGTFRNALVGALNQRRQDGAADANWTFHVIAGLAGGTGSGTLIDVLGQIRDIQLGLQARLVAYVVLPEPEETTWAKENYHANGYAALTELNAYIVRRFRPINLNEPSRRYQPEIPANNVFVVTNRNDQGLIADMARTVPAIIAETMFQIIVASGDARARGAQAAGAAGADQRVWRDMVTGENYFGGYERDDENGPDERANRFLSFGVKRVAIPDEEIREYAAMVFARQFVLQALNDHWVDGEGFAEVRRHFDGLAEVRSDGNRQKWLLSDRHLRLELPTLENDRADWRNLPEEFRIAIGAKTKFLINNVRPNQSWARELETFAVEFYDRGFRNEGVNEFYRLRERSVDERARMIIGRVASDMFDDWRSGRRSLRDLERIAQALIEDLTERGRKTQEDLQRLERDEKAREAERQTLFDQFVKPGFIRPRRQILEQLSEKLAHLFGTRALRKGIEFQIRVMTEALVQAQALKATIETAIATFETAYDEAERRRAARVRVNETAAAAHEFKLYDPAHVRALLRRIEQREQVQREQVAALRDRLIEALGARPDFDRLAELNGQRLVALIESDAETRAERALEKVENDRDRILNASVVQKLHEEYQGRDEELRRFISERVAEAGNFAPLNPGEQALGNGNPVNRAVVAFVPAAEELREGLREFHAELVRAIRGAGAGRQVEIVETRGRGNEIVFLSLVNQFPLRYLQPIAYLRQRYARLLAGTEARRKRLELHIEGDGTQLPNLFIRGIEEVRRDLRGHWLIAEVANLLIERRNPATGEMETVIKSITPDGEVRMPRVGGRIAEGTARLTHQSAQILRDAVESYLRQLIHVDDREAVVQKLIARQNQVLEASGFNELSDAFVAVQQDVRVARGLLAARQG